MSNLPTMTDLTRLTAAETAARIGRGEVSAQEVWDAYQARARALDPVVRAYLHLEPAEFAQVDSHPDPVSGYGAGGDGVPPVPASNVLAGVPYALKDNMSVAGVPMTCGSRILAGFVPPYNATVTRRLRAAGGRFMGKTNMDEFAMGSSCEHSAYFPTHNPWRLDLVPGGSSGGSAAAVAADMTAFALGSDTGGSVRQPAAFCGIVGLKPTYGLVSRYGLVAFASSLDQIGPLTKDVTDCALVLNLIAGHDPLDSTSVAGAAQDYRAALVPEVKGMRFGLPREYMGEGIQPGVRAAIERSVAALCEMGAIVEECSLPHTEYGVATYYIVAPAEASANLARFDGMRYGYRTPHAGDLRQTYDLTRSEGFGPEVKRRIMIGTYVLSAGYYDAYYLRAQKVRTLVQQDFAAAFERFDAIIGPTTPTTAFGLAAKIDDPLQMYLNDVFTLPVNLAGLPGLSIPCGLSDGLPVGLQLIGPHFGEPTLLRAAYALECALGVRNPKPPIQIPDVAKGGATV